MKAFKDKLKEKKGQEVIVLPTGNFARIGARRKLKKAVIVNIGRVNVKLNIEKSDGSGFVEAICRINEHVGCLTMDNANAGYQVFDTVDDAKRHFDAVDTQNRLRDDINKLSEPQLLAIKDLLGWTF